MYKRIFALAICVIVIIVSGCALTTDRVSIQYNPQQGIAKIPGANNVSVSVQVDDQRQEKEKVSSKKNSYGKEMAPIVATEDIAVTFRRAIEQELQARGFQIDSDMAQVLIAAVLTRFYNDHKMGFFSGDAVADLNISVNINSRKGELLYTRQVNAQGIEPNTQLASGENARLALNRALENGMKSLFEDQAFLAALINSSASTAAAK